MALLYCGARYFLSAHRHSAERETNRSRENGRGFDGGGGGGGGGGARGFIVAAAAAVVRCTLAHQPAAGRRCARVDGGGDGDRGGGSLLQNPQFHL